jgi:hypothetical protein
MKRITVSISESEFKQFGFQSNSIVFHEFLNKIKNELAQKALERCHKTAQEVGISNITMDEINAEIKAVRKDAKNSR